MLSTNQITESIKVQTFTFAAVRLAYRALSGVADDVERIGAAGPVLLRGIATLAVWLLTAVCFALPGLFIVAQAIALVAIPGLAMYAVLTVPGLPLCLVVLVLFGFITWPRMAVRHG